MKHTFTILKITGIVVLCIAAALGFVFFQTWQKNERPKTISVAWEKEHITLGHAITLDVTLQVPWHREILTANPSNYPDILPPLPKGASLTRGRSGLDGKRTWTASIPVVPTAIESVEGLTLSLPLAPTKRPSPSSINIPLPALAIFAPGNLPKLANNPKDFASAKITAPVIEIPKEETNFPWLLITLTVLALGVMIFFYLRQQNSRSLISAWQVALGDLAKLEQEKHLTPDTFFSRLTDILKSYTSERFDIPATAKTSSEFLVSVYELENVPQTETMELPWLARLADNVKFAGHTPEKKDPKEALQLVKNFVTLTKPAPDLDDDA